MRRIHDAFAGASDQPVTMPRHVRYLEQAKAQICASEYCEVTGLAEQARYLRLRLPLNQADRSVNLSCSDIIGNGGSWH